MFKFKWFFDNIHDKQSDVIGFDREFIKLCLVIVFKQLFLAQTLMLYCQLLHKKGCETLNQGHLFRFKWLDDDFHDKQSDVIGFDISPQC